MAGGFLGTLAVGLSVHTAPLVAGFKRAKAQVATFAGSVKAATAKLAGFSTGLLGVVAATLTVTAAISGMRKAFGEIDEIAKLARQTNSTTEGIVALRHQAELTGASTQVLDKGMQNLVRRLGEARQGTGEGVRGLETLGLSANKLSAMRTDQAFAVIADAIGKIPNKADQAAAAYQLFGRSGMELLNMLNEGSEGIDRARKSMDELGATFTMEEAGRVEALNDSWTRLTEAFGGLARRIAIALAPALQSVVEWFTKIVVGIRVVVEWVSKGIETWSGLGAAIRFGITAMVALVTTVGAVILAMKAWAVAQATVLALSGPKGWAVLAAGAAIAVGATLTVNAAFGELTKEVRKAKSETETFDEETLSASNSLEKEAEAAKKAAAELERYKQQLQQRGDQIAQSLRKPGEIFKDEVSELNKLVRHGFISWETYSRGVDKAKESLASALDVKTKIDAPKFQAALEKGTTAAFTAVEESKRAVKQAAEEKKMADRRDSLLSKISDSVSVLKSPPPVVKVTKVDL